MDDLGDTMSPTERFHSKLLPPPFYRVPVNLPGGSNSMNLRSIFFWKKLGESARSGRHECTTFGPKRISSRVQKVGPV